LACPTVELGQPVDLGRVDALAGQGPLDRLRVGAHQANVDHRKGHGSVPVVPAIEVSDLVVRYVATIAVDGLSFNGDPGEVDGLLERVGLGGVASSTWRRLSGGEQQRLSLALALVGRPEVAFLDEPTAGIDPAGRQVVRAVVRELRDAGVCVLLTTHELEEAE